MARAGLRPHRRSRASISSSRRSRRKAASLPNYSYSGALKGANVTWTNDKLKAWVMGPYKLVPGTKMAFGGISDAGQADDVVAYLDSLK